MEAGLKRPPSDNLPAFTHSERADAALAAAGDSRAFERLYLRHVARIHSLVRRMVGGGEDADEIVQDVFVRAWERLSTFRGEAAFGTWLYRLAVNVVLNRFKGDSRGRRLFDDAAELELVGAPARQPEAAMDLEQAVAKLPRGARQVFVLHDVDGFRHEEIGEMLGVTAGTSKAQLHRARMLLRGFLER